MNENNCLEEVDITSINGQNEDIPYNEETDIDINIESNKSQTNDKMWDNLYYFIAFSETINILLKVDFIFSNKGLNIKNKL